VNKIEFIPGFSSAEKSRSGIVLSPATRSAGYFRYKSADNCPAAGRCEHYFSVSKTPATVTQADVARIIRAAKQAGAISVEVRIGERTAILIHLTSPSTAPLEPDEQITL
jgi:hypothetical protein